MIFKWYLRQQQNLDSNLKSRMTQNEGMPNTQEFFGVGFSFLVNGRFQIVTGLKIK